MEYIKGHFTRRCSVFDQGDQGQHVLMVKDFWFLEGIKVGDIVCLLPE
jgi:hypothetical protein